LTDNDGGGSPSESISPAGHIGNKTNHRHTQKIIPTQTFTALVLKDRKQHISGWWAESITVSAR